MATWQRVRNLASAFSALLGRCLGGRMRSILLLIGVLVTAFAYGAASDRYKFFPYYELRPLFSFVENRVGFQSSEIRAVSRLGYRTEKALSTSLLPLRAETFNLTTNVKMNPTAGAICQIGNGVLILDRLGQPFRFDLTNKTIDRVDWPLLPTDYDEFLKSPMAAAKSNFRVHDLLCVRQGSTYRVFAAHEFFDTAAGKTRLIVSDLHVDEGFKPLDKNWGTVFTSATLPGTSYAANGAGGRMASDDKNGLYLTIGDYNLDGVLNPGKEAQNPTGDLGSIFRIDLKSGIRKKISLGHRNPQGLVVLRGGEILSTEQGPKGGDELNRIIEGKNYGWPFVTYGTDYDSYSWPLSKNQGRHEEYEKPIFAWVPSIAAGKLIEVKDFNDRWNGDLLVASLKAGTLFRLRYEDGAVKYSEPIWFGPRIRDVIELSENRIALWTDQSQLIILSTDKAELNQNKRAMAPVIEPGSINCMACHHVGVTNETDAAPSLSGILNRKVASDSYANYSDALKNLGGEWTEDRLRAFLLNPNEYAPGTSMVIGDLSKSQVEKAITYLRNLD